jgi:hypothetical protein
MRGILESNVTRERRNFAALAEVEETMIGKNKMDKAARIAALSISEQTQEMEGLIKAR